MSDGESGFIMIEKIRFGLELIQKSGFAVKGWVRMPRKLKSFAVIIIALHIIWLGFAVFCIWTNTNEKNVRQPEEKQGQIVFENENIEYQFSLIIQENTESEEKSFLDIIDFKEFISGLSQFIWRGEIRLFGELPIKKSCLGINRNAGKNFFVLFCVWNL